MPVLSVLGLLTTSRTCPVPALNFLGGRTAGWAALVRHHPRGLACEDEPHFGCKIESNDMKKSAQGEAENVQMAVLAANAKTQNIQISWNTARGSSERIDGSRQSSPEVHRPEWGDTAIIVAQEPPRYHI